MPVMLSWFIPERVVYVDLDGDVTADEIRANAAEFAALVDTSPAPLVHVLQDATDLTSLPRELKALSDAVQIGYGHPRLGWTVAFGVRNDLLRFIGGLTSRLFSIRYRIVDTQADAIEWLAQMDITLPKPPQG